MIVFLNSRLRLLALAAVVLALGAAAWLILAQPPKDEVWREVQSSGVLRVGMDASYPPFEDLDQNGEIVGFDVDFAREVGRRLNLRVEFVNIAYDGLFDALLTHRVDVLISALADLPQRAGKTVFTLPYYNAGDTLVVKEGSGIRSIEDMGGRVLAVEFGSGGDVEGRKWQRRLAKLAIKSYPDPDSALGAILKGEADGALVDGIAARLGVGQHPELALAGNVNDTLFGIATLSDSAELRSRLDEVIQEMLRDGTIAHLTITWFGPQRDVGP